MVTQVSVEGVSDAVAVRVVLEAKKWQGESSESYTQRSEDLCYQVRFTITSKGLCSKVVVSIGLPAQSDRHTGTTGLASKARLLPT